MFFMYMLPINGRHFGTINIVPKWVRKWSDPTIFMVMYLAFDRHTPMTWLTMILSSLVGYKLGNNCSLPTKMKLTIYKIDWLIWTYKLRQLHKKESSSHVCFVTCLLLSPFFSSPFNTVSESLGFCTVNILSARTLEFHDRKSKKRKLYIKKIQQPLFM